MNMIFGENHFNLISYFMVYNTRAKAYKISAKANVYKAGVFCLQQHDAADVEATISISRHILSFT